MIIDEFITIKPKESDKFDFIVDFPDILTKNLNEPITSPIYFTNSICEQFIIDFTTNSLIFKIIDFQRSNFFNSEITFLNQNIKKSTSIKYRFVYGTSKKHQSQQLPISIQEIIDPKNGWLFDGCLRFQVVFKSYYCTSHLYPIVIKPIRNKLRFIIPVSLFNLHIKEKIINLNPVERNSLKIYPFILFDYKDDRLLIQTNFNITFSEENVLFDFVSFYENKDPKKNAISIFANIDAGCAQMDSILLEKNLDESNFVFDFNESKKVLYLDLFIQYFGENDKELSPRFLDHFLDKDIDF